ncbi:MAG: hypothetical protein R3C20_17880 [Planctomycetaceae bacterium]
MFLEPEFTPPKHRTVHPEHLPLFDRVLRESEDSELQEQAAVGLTTFARESLADISRSFDILRRHLTENPDAVVQLQCAMALVAADDQDSADPVELRSS